LSFSIIQCIGLVVYKLLSSTACIHFILHVSQLKS